MAHADLKVYPGFGRRIHAAAKLTGRDMPFIRQGECERVMCAAEFHTVPVPNHPVSWGGGGKCGGGVSMLQNMYTLSPCSNHNEEYECVRLK